MHQRGARRDLEYQVRLDLAGDELAHGGIGDCYADRPVDESDRDREVPRHQVEGEPRHRKGVEQFGVKVDPGKLAPLREPACASQLRRCRCNCRHCSATARNPGTGWALAVVICKSAATRCTRSSGLNGLVT